MTEVAYVQPSWGLPGVRYFICAPLAATMAVGACEANWRASHGPAAERLWKCKTCPVGAIHAGETAASLSPLRGSKVCSRCQTGTTRMIGGWLCVSCYNREREFVAGRDARGKAPIKASLLHRRTVRVTEAGVTRVLARDLTGSMEELVFGALRDCKRVATFSFNGSALARYSQASLWA